MGEIRPIGTDNGDLFAQTNATSIIASQFVQHNPNRNEQIQAANSIIAANIEAMGIVKPSLNSIQECKSAVEEYLHIIAHYNAKPTIPGFCIALGITRKQFVEICETGTCVFPKSKLATIIPDEVHSFFTEIRENYSAMVEGFMEANLIQPSAASFLLKNNGGYKDVTETKSTIVSASVDISNLAEKYRQELSEL